MAKTREIKKRIKAVKNIQRITRTMQMIATSKFARSQARAEATKPYTEGIFELVQELAATAGNVSHPLIEGPQGGFRDDARHLTLVITSDRGLCGPYNGSVLRTAYKHLRGLGGASRVEVVGKKGVAFMRFNGVDVYRHHTQFGDRPEFEPVKELAQHYIELFEAGRITGVSLVYMRYQSVARQSPTIVPLLPLKPPAVEEQAGGFSAQYEFSPDAQGLLAELLPETVKTTLFQAFNDAVVSENIARMVAMKAATDNAGKMGKALKRKFNRARQAQITTELNEIVSGAAALG
ncbi:MAG: ATP synthase F1 subunit gamma [Phycisphaeraceae bacterium]|nr:ATP synthase F1 subunit gamma [Phycisphaeraceae bacterium]